MQKILLFVFSIILVQNSSAQISNGSGQGNGQSINKLKPRVYEIASIAVTGTENLDGNAIKLLSGLAVGDQIKIPGSKTSEVIKNLWKQGLFSDVKLNYSRIEGDRIFLEIHIAEQPRLSRFSFKGVSKGEADDLREEINLYREKIVTTNLLLTTEKTIKKHFVDKGYLNTTVNVIQKNDTLYPNHVILNIKVDRQKKVKINKIHIAGNTELKNRQVKAIMKETKERSKFRPFYELDDFLVSSWKALWSNSSDSLLNVLTGYNDDRIKLTLFKTSKYLPENLKMDESAVVQRYNSKGYRDAQIRKDSIVQIDNENIDIYFSLDEGSIYHFRNINWIGNSKYSTEVLNNVFGINSGDVYNSEMLEQRLFMNPNGGDISSLYMDDGYLFFQVNPIETSVSNDSVDLELRIFEGEQARINRIFVVGNSKTNDHVVMREIRTRPGDLFSRSEIIRTQRELSVLGYFDPEQMNVVPKPNPSDGTVDIEYTVAERPSDQIELSGGWGAGTIIGTLGLSFNNFSLRNLFNGEAYTPLPSGDGQRLSLRAQTNGSFYSAYSFSFTEPWLGGKKPNAFSVSINYQQFANGGQRKYITEGDIKVRNPNYSGTTTIGASVGLGKRLKWPDDNFSLYQEVTFQKFNVVNASGYIQGLSNGSANNAYLKFVLSRSSISDLNFPRSGNQTTLSTQFTLPYSWFNNKNYGNIDPEEKYEWIEYHKWKFTSAWYTSLTRSEKPLVLYAKFGVGILAMYNQDVGTSPFERFTLGGSGLSGFQIDGREIIALRGYDDNSLSSPQGSPIITKSTVELRYPLSLSQSAMIYMLGFVEAGNTWESISEYDPFELNRAAGVGVRVFLPMFGLLGLDYGWRLDDSPYNPNMQKGQLHFTIGANLGQL